MVSAGAQPHAGRGPWRRGGVILQEVRHPAEPKCWPASRPAEPAPSPASARAPQLLHGTALHGRVSAVHHHGFLLSDTSIRDCLTTSQPPTPGGISNRPGVGLGYGGIPYNPPFKCEVTQPLVSPRVFSPSASSMHSQVQVRRNTRQFSASARVL